MYSTCATRGNRTRCAGITPGAHVVELMSADKLDQACMMLQGILHVDGRSQRIYFELG